MSKIAITFADELRARSDEDLAALFKFRPDLVTPVPNDFTSLAARATSTPSLVRALDSLNLWHYQIIEAACVLAEPFKKSEIVSITSQESNFALDYLWQMGLLYKEGNNFRTPLNLKLLIGEEPVGLGPELGSKVDFNKLKDIPKTSADVLSRLTWGPPRGQITNIKKPGAAIGWLLDNNILVAIDSNTVALPREYAIKLRGDKVHRELTTKPSNLVGRKVSQNQADLDDQILPTSSFDIWLSKPSEERWYSLVVLWLDTSRVSGLIGRSTDKNIAPLGPELDRAGASLIKRTTLKVLLENLEISPEVSSIKEVVKWWNPQRFNGDFVEWSLREAEWLGLTGQGALSVFGKNLLSSQDDLGIESALPKPVDHILIQADNSAVAPGPLTAELSAEMGTIADIESRGGATVYRFSEASIRRGLDHGKTGDQIKTFLTKISKTPMPQPLEYLLSQPNLRRAKSRPKPPRIISEFSAPKESVITSAVKTIRAGERSRKVEPIVPGTSSNETLALINQYINNQQTIAISYADNNGGVINRIIEPISISLGTLTAKDEASGEITQFRIPRINGVAPAFTISQNKADLDL